jgi:hypothetical protein
MSDFTPPPPDSHIDYNQQLGEKITLLAGQTSPAA